MFNNNIADVIFQQLLIISKYAKTQNIDITEQLESGIRYLDVRLASIISHIITSKILFFTRDNMTYDSDKQLGIQIPIFRMGDCEDLYIDDTFDYDCLPKLSCENLKYCIQDAYNLNAPNKWELVTKVINNEIDSFYKNDKNNVTYITVNLNVFYTN